LNSKKTDACASESAKSDYRRSNLPGSVMMLFSNPKTPSTAIPSNLNGSVSTQKIGYSTNAKIASGQQSIKRIIQAMNVNMG